MPDVGNTALNRYCRQWHEFLAPYSNLIELRHLNRAPENGPALLAHASRLLARLTLIYALTNITTSKLPINCLETSHTYSGIAAFTGFDTTSRLPFSIDAVDPASINPGAIGRFFKKAGTCRMLSDKTAVLRCWLLFECLVKLAVPAYAAAKNLSSFLNLEKSLGRKGAIQIDRKTFYWKFFSLTGHLIGLCSITPPLPSASMRWLPWQKVNNFFHSQSV